MASRFDSGVVIIGAGLAGAATAFGLAQRGVRNLVILEQADIPGFYASGRNAAMVRQLVSDPLIRRLVRHGIPFLESPPYPFEGSAGFRNVGSMMLASGADLQALRSWVEADNTDSTKPETLDCTEVERRIPVAAGGDQEGGVWMPGDGVLDVHALLHGFLGGARACGAKIRCGSRVARIHTRAGWVSAVQMDGGETVPCSAVVNAAGAWAGQIGRLAGIAHPAFLTLRRHLALAGPATEVDPSWPFVWNISHEVYFRPESGCALLSPCDEEPIDPCDPPANPAALELLANKVVRCFPGLQHLGINRSWACIRTFASDRRMVLGEDPRVRGF